MKKSITQKYSINGPNNVIRLTNGDKIIYIFGEFHIDLTYGVECDNIKSMDIDKFLLKFMEKEKNRNFDIFIEMTQYSINYYKNNLNYKLKHIHRMRKIVSNNYNIKNNKIMISNNFPNYRFHYFDFRENIDNFLNYELIDKYYNYLLEYNYPYNYTTLFFMMNDISELINILNNLLDKLSLNKNQHILIDKIKNKYENINIKESMNKIYNIVIIKYIKYIINKCNDLLNYIKLNTVDKLYISNYSFYEKKRIKLQDFILEQIILIKTHLLNPFFILTDLYLLRRLLDKKYTKNNIIYCGMHHLADITILLVKYFNFKITNIYYDVNFNNENINKLDINNYYDYYNLINNQSKIILYDYKEVPNQCINLFNFPPNFT